MGKIISLKQFIIKNYFLIIALIVVVVILIQILVFMDTVFAANIPSNKVFVNNSIISLLEEYSKYDSHIKKLLELAKTNGILHHPELQKYLKLEIIPERKMAKMIIDECLRIFSTNYSNDEFVECLNQFKISIKAMKKHSEFLDELYNRLYWKKYGK